LAAEAYGRLLFDNFSIIGFVDYKIVVTCQPGSGPAEDRPGPLYHEDANLIQESIYSGYVAWFEDSNSEVAQWAHWSALWGY
jgi:hypothetical protein